ncbi:MULTISPECIES: methyl-accepting chemotaxis protein [unclassified Arsukibacterium]|uniref:methyl-accepting chemotaxis protein n=1 Tax=unclassified Arsukibacterium TaxID=2635278 RepID=UPI000C3C77B7|nr:MULTISPECIES: methyl-accepting chemotaxis protein [unclassified Arsukibacterium]MAA95610.1 methyl-accepting chemotaxis protein [Rheinheimera sp.]MBM33200.1 methyl-accepting chemotaxis protein [Rheinheimera sp.]HAW92583.1 methyl-accepting chemotaxis protein [Candidatus Azambacteria bacterium]|tara:strand:+ start:19660 stop:21672 length:2013 start_codon:yes stop_codon:yes gene_type:complete
MKLTVALRVMGGFAIISLLLLFIGVTAYISLNNISNATTEVNEVSIPALENSATMKTEFVTMSRASLQGFYADSLEKTAAVNQRFAQEKVIYDRAADALRQAIEQHPELRAGAEQVSETYRNFIEASTNLQRRLDNNIRLRSTIAGKLNDLEFSADDMASLILDFTDVRDVQRRFPRAYEAATQIETGINTLINNVIDLNRTETDTTVATVTNEIAFRLQELREQVAIIQQQAGSAVSMTADIAEKVQQISGFLEGPDGIPALKVQLLAGTADAEAQLATANQYTQTGMQRLDTLLNLTRSAAQEIEQNASSGVDNAITWIFIVVIISIILSVFIATVTVRRIVKPLAEVNNMLGVVASGDLTKTLDASAKDEFGELSRNVNTVVSNLQQLIQGIISRSTQLAAASEQTSAITVQTTQAIREQKSQVTQAATATTEMSSTSQGVLQSSNDALAEIKNADKEAERVKGISLDNKSTIIQLSKEVEQASVVINKLHKDSASIGSILDVIRGIAEQTNLLALNAAIEAARAGEQGRGFAVVADEVRSLASKTQASTQEIQAMIQVLQSGAQAAVEAMNKGKKQAENCVTQTEVATSALDSITHAVHLAHDMSEQISGAAKEQNQVSNEISQLLESIVAIAEETASGAEQTSDSSHEVARLAEELRQSVAQFRV